MNKIILLVSLWFFTPACQAGTEPDIQHYIGVIRENIFKDYKGM